MTVLWKRSTICFVCLVFVCLLQSVYIFTYSLNCHDSSSSIEHKSPSLKAKYERLFVAQENIENEKLTLVVLTYKRENILPRITKHYCTMTDSLKRILIIWNDVETPISNSILKLSSQCQVELKFIISKENKLTNRFLPRDEIITEGVLMIDDDRLIFHDDVKFGLEIWQQYRHKIVGFEHRMHSIIEGGKYHYSGSAKFGYTPEKVGYSIMLTGSAILHKLYLELFHSSYLPAGVFEYINKEFNCEDIAMCIMVTKFLRDTTWPQSCALSVKPKVTVANLEAISSGGHRGLSNKPRHYDKRSECLNEFATFYNGTLPLVYTSGRIYREPFNPWYTFKLT